MSSAFVDAYGNDPACFREGMPPATQQGSFRILSFVGSSRAEDRWWASGLALHPCAAGTEQTFLSWTVL